MPCFSPLKGYKSKTINPSGKRSIVFTRRQALDDGVVNIPCGQCIGCRLKRSRDWAIRCLHEASLYDDNCFITLTFSPEHLPDDMSVDVKVFRLFLDRLRNRIGYGQMRYFHCGEYGSKSGRPHYHAILFNFDFKDKYEWMRTPSGEMLYRSPLLEEVWPYGFSSIGSVTFESAAYVARYVMKKVTGPNAAKHYEYIDPSTGEVFIRKPEYTTMSRRPGIAKGWFDRYQQQLLVHDFIIVGNRKISVPRYYDKLFERANIDTDELQQRRYTSSIPHSWNNQRERLAVREHIQLSKFKRLKRPLED